MPADRIVRITRDGIALNEGNTPLDVAASGVFVDNDGLETLRKGRYEVTFADGRTAAVDYPEEVGPVTVGGPWQVEFLERPQLGKPFSATYDTLKSWTESSNHAAETSGRGPVPARLRPVGPGDGSLFDYPSERPLSREMRLLLRFAWRGENSA